MEARVITKKNYTWEEVGDILEAGRGKETFGLGKMIVKVEGIGAAVLKILDYDKDKSAMDPMAQRCGLKGWISMRDRSTKKDQISGQNAR